MSCNKKKKVGWGRMNAAQTVGEKKSNNGPYVAWQELDDHAHDERRPEDVQHLQGAHQPVEEVIAEEGRVEAQRVHHCCVYDPA